MTQQFDCRLLHRANAPVQQQTSIAPGMNTARGAVERERLAESGLEKNPRHPTTILVLRNGKIYFQGPADEVLHSSDSYLKEFLASAE